MTEMKTVSVLLDDETLQKVIELQKETNTFSRAGMLRELIQKALEENK